MTSSVAASEQSRPRVLLQGRHADSARYTLQFEADHGTLEAALSVQQRRREALGERPGDAARLPLLKYRHMGIWPTATPSQRRHFEAVLGERPAPAEDVQQPGTALLPAHTDVVVVQLIQQPRPQKSMPENMPSCTGSRASYWAPSSSICCIVQGHATEIHLVAKCMPRAAACGFDGGRSTLREPPSAGPAEERVPEGAAPKPTGPEEPPAAAGSNITKFPHELGVFIAGLPPPSVPIGPAPDVDAVIDVRRRTAAMGI